MIHYNFPITLLKGFTEAKNQRGILFDIQCYATYCKANNLNEGLIEDAIENTEDAIEELKFSPDVDPRKLFEKGSELFQKHSDSAHCGISKEMLFKHLDSIDSGGTISDNELIQLLGFLAVKSILGKNSFKKMTSIFLLSRMSGNNKQVKLDLLPDFIIRKMNDYQIRKLKGSLCDSWGMVHYSRNMRGFYIGYKGKVTIDHLALIAERGKKKSKDQLRAKAEKEAQEKARGHLLQ